MGSKEERQKFVVESFAPLESKFEDIKKAGEAVVQQLEDSKHDALTDLLGREKFLLKVKEKQGSGNEKGAVGSILFLDIDRFKDVNDHYGHTAGDLVLQKVAEHLKEACDEDDLICRWGGEEIVVFFPSKTPQEILKKFESERLGKSVINLTVDASEVKNNLEIPITFSGGIAEVVNGEDIDTTVHIADSAMYRVKHDPKNSRNRLEIANSKDKKGALLKAA